MVVTCVLRLRHRGCPSERFGPGVSLVEISGDRGFDLYVLQAPDEASLEQTLRSLEAYVGVRAEVIERSAGGVVFRHRNPAGGTIDAIRASGCSILWPAVWRGGEELFTVVAEDRERLRGLLARLGAMGTVRVERASDVLPEGLSVAVPLADLTSRLTQRQLDVLLRAVEDGYYESPRRTTTSALAAGFGVSPSTLKEHLRKAEGGVLHRLGALLAEHPVLARGATRGPGRPRGP